MIDALEWVGPWNDTALGFHRIADYYYGPGFHEGGPALELIINKKAYESLPLELKVLVKGACATENMLMCSEYYANNMNAIRELRKNPKLHVLPYPDDILKAFFDTSREVVADTAKLGDINRRIYESYDNFRKGSMNMSKVTEYAFMKGRYLSEPDA